MANKRIDEIAEEVESMGYEAKKELYDKLFSLGVMGEHMDNKLILISLLGLTYQKVKEKNPNVTPFAILQQISGKYKDDLYKQTLEALSILVQDFVFGHVEISSCGLKSSNEIIEKIKQILNTWTPF